MEKWKKYIDKNNERFLNELFELLRIPSVSTDPDFSDDVFEAAEMVKEKLLEAGVDSAEVCPTDGYPVVYGEKIIDDSKPTVLVYGHYDVQPADPYDLWDTPPFEPEIRDEKIYARGSSDDKGQMYMHVKALEMMNETDSLPCNIKFMIEGEEEVGSQNFESFLKDNQDKLKADVALISDTAMIANDIPSITVSLRGLSYIEVKVTGPNRDLHSGIYGGAVDNPANVLCNIISKLKDENNRITVPNFYDDVVELSKKEREELAKVPFDLEAYKKELGIAEVNGEKGYNSMERTTIRPSMDINGMWSGYTEKGAKTIIPTTAQVKLSSRLVPNQDPKKINELIVKHIQKLAPPSVKLDTTIHYGAEPVLTPTDSNEYKAAEKAIEATYGKTPVPLRTGGSIPIVPLIEKSLGIKTILMGFGLDSDAIHSPNESFGLFNFYKGIETIPHFYKNLGQ